jgi:ribose transport system ATP-binding protein
VALVPESRRAMLFHQEPVYKNISISILDRISSLLLKPAQERDIAKRQVEQLQIRPPVVGLDLGMLSGGNQQKVALARWLTTEPSVLILDEPTQGIDVGSKAEIHALIEDLAGRGLAIIMISSELPEILGMSDRIAVMRGGRIAGTLTRAEATPQALMALAVGAGSPQARPA